MESEKNNNKSVILSMFLIVMLFIAVIGLTYAIFTYSAEGKIKNKITTGTITFNYTETTNGIRLDNALPISDDIGKKLKNDSNNNGYFDFNDVFYEIYATKEQTNDELEEKYVKIYLTDGTTDEPITGYKDNIPTFDNLKKSISNEKSKQLYYGNFSSSGTQKFRLRMWISDEYMLVSNSEHFKIKVNVEASD